MFEHASCRLQASTCGPQASQAPKTCGHVAKGPEVTNSEPIRPLGVYTCKSFASLSVKCSSRPHQILVSAPASLSTTRTVASAIEIARKKGLSSRAGPKFSPNCELAKVQTQILAEELHPLSTTTSKRIWDRMSFARLATRPSEPRI